MPTHLSPAQMQKRVGDQTVAGLLSAAAVEFSDRPALRWKHEGTWRSTTYGDYGRGAAVVAAALRGLSVKPGERVSLMLRNRPEFHLFDLGSVLLRATPTSLYNSSSQEQIRYLLDHAESSVMVVDGPRLLEKVLAVRDQLPRLKHVVCIDDPEGVGGSEVLRWDELRSTEPLDLYSAAAAVRPDDIATVIYTSGTTGPPKGAELTHRSIRALIESLSGALGATFRFKRLISYMPMAHIAERGNTLYVPLRDGHIVHTVPEVAQLAGYLPEVRPQYLFGPPRIWEKLWEGMQAVLAATPPEQAEPCRESLRANDREAARRLLAAVALDDVEVAVTAAAAMPPSVLDGYLSLGIRLADGYGMTECGTVSLDVQEPRQGRVGRPLSGTEIRLAEDGEIEVNSAAAFGGYLKDPVKTAEAFTPDGWLRTGDIGAIDEDGYLQLVDRKKDLIITAGGKNISPTNIEMKLLQSPLVAQAVVIGEARKYVTALLVLDPQAASAWAARSGMVSADLAEIAAAEPLLAELQTLVDRVNESLARVEQIKRFRVLGSAWGPESDELTPTMKIKRRFVQTKYADEIDGMYE